MPEMATREPVAVRTTGATRAVLLDPPDYPARWGLVHHWRFDEVSGDRAATVGGVTLADGNNVPSAAGRFGLAASPAHGSSEYLAAADVPSLRLGDADWLVLFWLKYVSSSGRPFVGKWANGIREWEVENSSNVPRAQFSRDGTLTTVVSASTFGALTVGTWYLIGAYHDSVNNVVGCGVNGVWNTAAHTGGINGGTAPFEVGRINSTTTPVYGSGTFDELSIFRNPEGGIALRRDEIVARVYGGGVTPRPYPWDRA